MIALQLGLKRNAFFYFRENRPNICISAKITRRFLFFRENNTTFCKNKNFSSYLSHLLVPATGQTLHVLAKCCRLHEIIAKSPTFPVFVKIIDMFAKGYMRTSTFLIFANVFAIFATNFAEKFIFLFQPYLMYI
jgi:hypothetical protein